MEVKFLKKTTVLVSTAAMLLTLAEGSAICCTAHAEDIDDTVPKLADFDLNGDGDCEDEGEESWGYELDSAEDLLWFSDYVNNTNNGINAFLAKDITVNEKLLTELITVNQDGKAEINDGKSITSWTPAGNVFSKYSGTFDGAGHTISGLYSVIDEGYVGLFGYSVGGTIKNVTVADSYFCGGMYVGGICGFLKEGTLANCINTGRVTGLECDAGGVCGRTSVRSLIDACYNSGEVIGSDDVGGVCGFNYKAMIQNSYNTANITGANDVGGVCGYNCSEATIENCYNVGGVNCEKELTGMICGNNSEQSTITNCYYLINEMVAGVGVVFDGSAEVYAKTPKQFASGEVCWLLNRNRSDDPVFFQGIESPKDEFPVLDGTHHAVLSDEEGYHNEHSFSDNGFCTVCGDYEPADLVEDKEDIDGDKDTSELICIISNAGQLYWFANEVNSGKRSMSAYLAGDITVNSGVLDKKGELNDANKDKFRTWTPIGKDGRSNAYYGTFDGKGHTISGLYENDDSKKYVGLFGMSYGTIKNVGVKDSYFCGYENVGGICGSSCNRIESCVNFAFVEGYAYVGGISGLNYSGTTLNCHNEGATLGKHTNIGGICGYLNNKSTVQNCYNVGRVTYTETGTDSGDGYTGGICGSISSDSSVQNCFSTGKVESGKGAGGICGIKYTGCTIQNCFYIDTTTPDSYSTAMTEEQFKSGEVAYLLGSAFFQTLGSDDWPVLDNTHGTVYRTSKCVTYSNTDAGIKNHSPRSFAKVNATCTKEGLHAYWYCEDCGQYFANEECTEVIEDFGLWKEGDGIIPIADHRFVEGICEECGAYEDGIGARLVGSTVSLDGTIGVNFFLRLSETIVADENSYLLVKYPNGSDEKMFIRDRQPIVMDDKLYYSFRCNVAPAEIAETITAQVMTENGNGMVYSYSVKEYAEYILAHTGDNAEYAKAEKLVRAMLSYGTCSATFFGHESSSEAKLSSPEAVRAELAGIPATECKGKLPAGIEYYGSSLVLNSCITYRLYFKVDAPKTAEMYGLKQSDKDGLYYIDDETVSITQMGYILESHIGDAVYRSCPLSYVNRVLNSEESEELTNLCIAIYDYYRAAKDYVR